MHLYIERLLTRKLKIAGSLNKATYLLAWLSQARHRPVTVRKVGLCIDIIADELTVVSSAFLDLLSSIYRV